MSTIAEYLTALEGVRDQLADNLVKMGIEASRKETLKTLVPKILGIQQGNMSNEYCDLKLIEFPVSYGFFSLNETAKMIGAIEVNGFYMIRKVEIDISAEKGLLRLSVDAPNWEIVKSDTKISMVCDAIGKTKAQFIDLLDVIELTVSGDEDLKATVTMIVTGDETGDVIGVAGSTEIRFQKNSWEALEAREYTWSEIEAIGYTWEELEAIGKP